MTTLEKPYLERIAADLNDGVGVPLSWYNDPEIADMETAMFERVWQYVGHASQIAEPGQFMKCNVGRIPVVVVRNREGQIKAFRNVCRHRAAEVVTEPCGKARTLQCHYHAWTYDLDGNLVGAPRADQETDFDQSELGLIPVAVDTWGPFVFVNVDADAAPLADTLGEIPAKVAALGIDVNEMKFRRRFPGWTMNCNWKVAIENFLECYHCAKAHPGFNKLLCSSVDEYETTAEKTYAHVYAPLRPSTDAEPVEQREQWRDGVLDGATYFLIWPNLTVNINPGKRNMSLGPMVPRETGAAGVRGSVHYLDYTFADDVSDEWIDNMIAFDSEVGDEDATLVESVQRGIDSETLDRPRLLPTSEKLLLGFQKYLVEQHAITAGKAL